MLLFFCMLLIAYFVGSTPSGLILATYFTEVDVRAGGSGNIGATNVYRLTGRRMGALTLFFDVGKGALMVLWAEALFSHPIAVGLVALMTFLGHCYSIFLDFRGGKGVATAAGIYLVLAPLAGVLAAAAWVITVLRWKRSSLGALVAATALPLFIIALPGYRAHIWLTLALVGILVWRHRENIDRLLTGNEPTTTSVSVEGS